jgi:hypothetical protein
MYRIEVNESQMRVLMDALDFYERVLGLGQLEEIEHGWRWDIGMSPDFSEKSEALRNALAAAKMIGWGFPPNASRSIRSPEVPVRFRIAYDMTQVLRKTVSDVRLARFRADGKEECARWEMMTVSRNEFWATCEEQPPIRVEWSPKEEK